MDEIIGQYTCYTVALERDDDAYSRAPPLRSGATHKDGYQTTEGGCYIDARDLKRLIAAGETQFLEIKPGNEKPSELATSLAAFANATGGTLVLGAVERASGYEIEGVGDPKLALDHLYSAAALCSPTLDLLPPERVDIDGRDVFVATVPDDRRNAYSVDGRYQVRRGTFRRPLDSDEILALLSSRAATPTTRRSCRGRTAITLMGAWSTRSPRVSRRGARWRRLPYWRRAGCWHGQTETGQ